MNRDFIRTLGQGIFDNAVIEAICDPYYEKARGYRSAINRLLTDDKVVEFLIKYWNERSEHDGKYRRLHKSVVRADLPIKFREALGRIGLRRSGQYYTSAPVNHLNDTISISVYDLRLVQNMKHIWITWHHLYLLHLRRIGTITIEKMGEMWIKSQVEIEKFLEPYYDETRAHRLRCTLNRWANSGYLERKGRGVYQIR